MGNEVLSRRYFPRFKYQLKCLAKFIKHINGEEIVFHEWIESDFFNNYSNDNYSILNTLIQNLDDG